MSEDIWGLTDKVWETIGAQAEQAKKKYPSLIFHDEKKEEFNQKYKEKYNEIMSRFMTQDTKELDSHKQAAIIIICCLQVGVIEYSESLPDKKDEFLLLPQIIAVNVGLSFMQDCLTQRLKEKGIRKKVEQYYFPVAFACDTPYGNIMCRILYYEQNENDMDFNVLELSDRLFLLEYINLLQYGIDPTYLKESK